jgi:nitroreductase
METLEAIATRRSIGKVRPDRPPRDSIEKMLHAAVQAPNHFQTEPWRFWVLAGAAREELGRVMAEALKEKMEDPESEESRVLLSKEAEKPLRAPVLIVVGAKRSEHPKAVPVEDFAATVAAAQNMLLAAHDLGLAAMWRTGDPAYDPNIKEFFGLGAEDQLVGFFYVGYPAIERGLREREAGDKAEWRGWE